MATNLSDHDDDESTDHEPPDADAETASDTDAEPAAEFVDPDDLTVQRDSSGDALPQVKQAGQFGHIKVIPMAFGDVQEYIGEGRADIGASDMAAIFDEFVHTPDLSAAAGGRVDAEYVEGMKPLAPRDLLLAVLDASGVEADVEMDDDAGGPEATIDVQGN